MDIDQEIFSRKFKERQELFNNAITNIDLGFKEFEWHLYLDEQILEDDGNIYSIATLNSKQPNFDKEELIKYSDFVICQGFNVEVVFEYKNEKVVGHVVSWETEYEPDWPETIRPAVSVKWVPVVDQKLDLNIEGA